MKTKALISFAVTAKLICVFVFAYAKIRFPHDEAQIIVFSLEPYFGITKFIPFVIRCPLFHAYGHASVMKQSLIINVCHVPVECPPGYEPSPLENEDKPCLPCNFGYYKKYSGGADVFCDKCRKDQWTISTASTVMSECISKLNWQTCYD